MADEKITDEQVTEAWDRYVAESRGADRGSVRESAAWDRYWAVMKQWRNQR